jgi:hypothetical protein
MEVVIIFSLSSKSFHEVHGDLVALSTTVVVSDKLTAALSIPEATGVPVSASAAEAGQAGLRK